MPGAKRTSIRSASFQGNRGGKASIDPVLGKVYSRSHDAVIRVYDAARNVIETHEHKGDFKEW
jgi:hypothetical protein